MIQWFQRFMITCQPQNVCNLRGQVVIHSMCILHICMARESMQLILGFYVLSKATGRVLGFGCWNKHSIFHFLEAWSLWKKVTKRSNLHWISNLTSNLVAVSDFNPQVLWLQLSKRTLAAILPLLPFRTLRLLAAKKNPNHKFQIRLIAYLSTLSVPFDSFDLSKSSKLKQLILKRSCSLGESRSIGGRGMAKAMKRWTAEFRLLFPFQNVSRALWKEKI